MYETTSAGTTSPVRKDLKSRVLHELEAIGSPATVAQLQRVLAPEQRLTPAELRAALAEMVNEGTLCAWGKRYTLHHPESIIVSALRDAPLTQAELGRRLAAMAPGLATTAELRRALKALCLRGTIKQHPKTGKAAQRFGLKPPPLTPFVGPAARALRLAHKQLERSGVSIRELVEELAAELGVELESRAEEPNQARDTAAAPATATSGAPGRTAARVATLPGVPAAIRSLQERAYQDTGQVSHTLTIHFTRSDTLPDSPAARRLSPEEASVLSVVRETSERYGIVDCGALRSRCALEPDTFERVVLRLAEAGLVTLIDYTNSVDPPLGTSMSEYVQDASGHQYFAVSLAK